MEYLFYFLAIPLVIFSFMVVLNKNPVYSVLSLILVFINSAILFLMLNAEFIAMVLVIVYVGAVAVLFLFIVVMLGVEKIKQKVNRRVVIATLIISGLLLYELTAVYLTYQSPVIAIEEKHIDTYTIGQVLYTDYFYVFQIAGIILLAAMVGVIALTLQVRPFVKRQDAMKQMARKPDIEKVKTCY